jgi:hypothetical protein
MTTLSHTRLTKLRYCEAMYHFYYNEKLRSKYLKSPLFFGGAVDEALNIILLDKKKTLTDDEKKLQKKGYLKVYDEKMTTVVHNGETIEIDGNSFISYNKADFDYSILSKADIKKLKALCPEDEDLEIYIGQLLDKKHGKNRVRLDEKDFALTQKACYLSLYRKGLMLIDAYIRDIFPEIHEVFEIQHEIRITDDDGNGITGFIDAIVSLKDNPTEKVLLDNKTSSRAYKPDSVVTSEQLALYASDTGIYTGAFAVVEKTLRKKDPRARTQLIIDKINEEFADKVIDEFNEAIYTINKGEYIQNFESGCRPFGQPCEYYNYCHKNSMEQLVDLNKEKK